MLFIFNRSSFCTITLIYFIGAVAKILMDDPVVVRAVTDLKERKGKKVLLLL